MLLRSTVLAVLLLYGIPTGTWLKEDNDIISIQIDKKPVLTYHKSIRYPAQGFYDYYQRSGFIHPVYSPSGKILTDDFPKGHMHQHGLFFALVNTTFRGKPTDFWNQQNGTGTVRHTGIKNRYSADDGAGFTAGLEHLSIHDGDTSVAAMEEWEIYVHNRSDVHVIDFTSKLFVSGKDTLYVNEYHYGGLGFRGNAEWNDTDFEQPGDINYIGKSGKGGFLTSSGKTRMDGNHSHERWVSFHGEIGGDAAGIVIMSHPDNFRFPQAVRLHPVMPYFSFSPMVDGPFRLVKNDTLISTYRLLAHDGLPDPDWIEREWLVFTE
jgi:hypothetical protein